MHLATQKKYAFDFVPTLICRLSTNDFHAYFPVQFTEEEPLAVAEPSLSAAIEMESGFQFIAVYGTQTGNLEIFTPISLGVARGITTFLDEVRLSENCIKWQRSDDFPSK
jgi:hypothetical protein